MRTVGKKSLMRFSMKAFCGRVSDLAGVEAVAHFISSDFKLSSA